jgi:hypothetical protein
MKDLAQGVIAAVLAASTAGAGSPSSGPPGPLTNEHRSAAEAFRFRTPSSWTVGTIRENPEVLEARGGDVLVRIVYRPQETGYDGLHADCMLERLADAMNTAPQVKYEYDFVSWQDGPHRMLDSAFAVSYDQPVLGHRQWRQRNLTVVGDGRSVCIITYCPARLWKKSAPTRALVEQVVRSVEFAPWR